MNKLIALNVAAGLVLAFTTFGAEAAIVRTRPSVPSTPSSTVPGRIIQNDRPEADCADTMGHMRSVHRADIDAIHDQDVMLIHVCEDLTVEGRNSYGALFINGNVETLRQPIAHNHTLVAALEAEGLDQNDVVSLRFGGNDSIVLYVYDRDMN